MKITVLIDNLAAYGLKKEWGLSLYIEYHDKVILLDAGQSGIFYNNALSLGIPVDAVDFGVLSHGHDDHANGIPTFFEHNSKANFYYRDGECGNCYVQKDGKIRFGGPTPEIEARWPERVIRVSGRYALMPGVTLLPHSLPYTPDTGHASSLLVYDGKNYLLDHFTHEQTMVIESDGGLVIFNSCSHTGADAIIREVMAAFPGEAVKAYVGGLHIFEWTEDEINAFADRIKAVGLKQLYTGHCTGSESYKILAARLGDAAHQFYSGMQFEL